jgi:hypothetical protein
MPFSYEISISHGFNFLKKTAGVTPACVYPVAFDKRDDRRSNDYNSYSAKEK